MTRRLAIMTLALGLLSAIAFAQGTREPVGTIRGLVFTLDPDGGRSVVPGAKISLDGLGRNKMRVVPGVTSKAMSVASGYTPRSIVTPIVGAVYKKLGGG